MILTQALEFATVIYGNKPHWNGGRTSPATTRKLRLGLPKQREKLFHFLIRKTKSIDIRFGIIGLNG